MNPGMKSDKYSDMRLNHMQFKLPAVICYFNNCLRIG